MDEHDHWNFILQLVERYGCAFSIANAREFADAIGMSASTGRRLLDRLVASGWVKRIARGVYSAAPVMMLDAEENRMVEARSALLCAGHGAIAVGYWALELHGLVNAGWLDENGCNRQYALPDRVRANRAERCSDRFQISPAPGRRGLTCTPSEIVVGLSGVVQAEPPAQAIATICGSVSAASDGGFECAQAVIKTIASHLSYEDLTSALHDATVSQRRRLAFALLTVLWSDANAVDFPRHRPSFSRAAGLRGPMGVTPLDPLRQPVGGYCCITRVLDNRSAPLKARAMDTLEYSLA